MTSSSQSKTCPPATWTVAEGVKWLQKEGFTDQVAKFEAERVDGTALLSLTTDELKDELDVNKFGPRKRLSLKIDELRLVEAHPRSACEPSACRIHVIDLEAN
jgi:hypothetical protein